MPAIAHPASTRMPSAARLPLVRGRRSLPRRGEA